MILQMKHGKAHKVVRARTRTRPEAYPVEYRSIADGSSNNVISSVFDQVLLTRDPRLPQIGVKLNF
jgi:hypothetical protein